ncbi:hypothetical protein M0R04_05660 [Candidatus Dojkabacteria bacterium]|jgi:hypothetical protein|nr:hypothetical protein [Candidatus Dojkabacteria bacterium]
MGYFKKGPRRVDGCTFFQKHHFFTGGIAVTVTFFAVFLGVPAWVWRITAGFGVWLIWDDLEQHSRQIAQLKTLKYYDTYSFWHWWPEEMLLKLKIKERE